MNYFDSLLSFSGTGKVRVTCSQCKETFVTEFFVASNFKILSSEEEVKTNHDLFEQNFEVISVEKNNSFIELVEDELILGNYQLVEKHLCIFPEIKQKLNGDQKGKHRPVMHRPFAGLSEIMKK